MFDNLRKKIIEVGIIIVTLLCVSIYGQINEKIHDINTIKIDSLRVISSANEYLMIEPVPLTNFSCERSLGTKNDFYSEGDYWWPDSTNPNGPYIRKDGMTNPENFIAHRKVMRDMSIQVAALSAAYKITHNKKYAEHAVKHLRTWFVNKETRMNPNMNYAQAIKGICAGRGVGLIDGIHLVEPAQCLSILEQTNGINSDDAEIIKSWFAEFLYWMNTHEYGIDERERKNNHGSCWVLQAAQYAKLTNNIELVQYCINRFKNILLPNQMALDGSFPMELERTKPYGYSLFNIDIMAAICQILSTHEDNLWEYKLPDGQGMQRGMEFIYPFIKDKSKWPFQKDVMYWDQWPVRHPSLLFTGIAYNNQNYLELWEELPAEPKSEEGLRNFPIRQPVLWIN
ncbi:MAG: alginate lyase family protein [Bacteroidetes bacterium]|nr:alginate lyase family protein [Bacteroidota bacterium]MBU1117045.1 alginate lyase family protein [Bacteroidota bacterium]MBU1797640.1 alginate lyase family protein [Bacteroidota bacterium]